MALPSGRTPPLRVAHRYRMSSSTAQKYIELFDDDEQAKLALLACSAALRLDDETAYAIIELVAKSNGSTGVLLRRVKNLGCVWVGWDGLWYITEDVRPHLLERLHRDVPSQTLVQLRERLAATAEARAERLPPDGQVTDRDKLLSKFEAAYQHLLTATKSQDGATQLAELWQQSQQDRPDAAFAIARSVDYLAADLESQLSRLHLSRLPDEIVFLQGMAARARGDRRNEEKYFRQVWDKGRPGYIYAVAAHLFGKLVKDRDRKTAERAMRDSIEWYESSFHRKQVYNSLGNLLAKERGRWREAEQAFEASLKLDDNDRSRAETLNSLGNLLAKDRARRREAEQTFEHSLKLDHEERSRAETKHSLGNLLAKDPERWRDAERLLRQSLEARDISDYDRAQRLHSLGNLLAKDPGRWEEAERLLRQSRGLAQDDLSRAQRLHSLGKLLFKLSDPKSWAEAESSLRESVRLLNSPEDKAWVLETLANALVELNDTEADRRAEQDARRGIELAPDNMERSSALYRTLVRVYERREDYPAAIKACQDWKNSATQHQSRKFMNDAQDKIQELTRKMQGRRKPRQRWWEG